MLHLDSRGIAVHSKVKVSSSARLDGVFPAATKSDTANRPKAR